MFIIRPTYPSEWQNAMFILSNYNVNMALYSDGKNERSVYGVVEANMSPKVEEHRDEEALHLAEMAFQMNWRQGDWICPYCKDHPEEPNQKTCGHLAFISVIDSSAFDKAVGKET